METAVLTSWRSAQNEALLGPQTAYNGSDTNIGGVVRTAVITSGPTFSTRPPVVRFNSHPPELAHVDGRWLPPSAGGRGYLPRFRFAGGLGLNSGSASARSTCCAEYFRNTPAAPPMATIAPATRGWPTNAQ